MFNQFFDYLAVKRHHYLRHVGKKVLPQGHWEQSFAEANQPPICLTFDDGPCPDTTPRLLELLAEENLQATFFLIGSRAERHPELLQMISQAGHIIGNHGYKHQFMPLLNAKEMEKEIVHANNAIFQITGKTPEIFRPPFGVIDSRVAACLREQGMKTVYWGAVADDWQKLGAQRVVQRVMGQVHPGGLIVLHENKSTAVQTVSAAKEIIYKCRELGYEIRGVNVSA